MSVVNATLWENEMSVKREILSFGFDKNGEADFGACADVCNLSYEQMQALRAMIPVGIAQMERMWFAKWFDEWMKHPENRAAQSGTMGD